MRTRARIDVTVEHPDLSVDEFLALLHDFASQPRLGVTHLATELGYGQAPLRFTRARFGEPYVEDGAGHRLKGAA